MTGMPRSLWRLTGALAIAHVVLMVVGIGLQQTPSLREGTAGITRSYGGADLSRVLTGGFVEVVAFVCMLPVLVFVSQVVGRRTHTGLWASKTALSAGVVYVAITLGTGFAAGAASLWAAQNGLDATTGLAVNDIRNFAFYLSLAPLGVHAIGLGIAAITDRGQGARWIGTGGLGTGVVLLAAVPGAALGLQDYATLVWVVWWVGVAVILLRHDPGVVMGAPETATAEHSVRQA